MQTFALCISISHIIQSGAPHTKSSITEEGFFFSLSVLGQMKLYECEPVNFVLSPQRFFFCLNVSHPGGL